MTSGLRERKKLATRRHIAETARALFAERGFDGVRVSEIARAAEVSEQTVFNYFPTKEDLVYWRLASFEEELLAAIRDRAPGESALAAFGRFVTAPRGMLAEHDEATRAQLAELTRTIVSSPALVARERQILAGYTDSLARLLAAETGADPDDAEPRVAAEALMGVHRSLIELARRRIEEGAGHEALAREVRAQAAAALGLLENGLSGYDVKPG